jgi:protein tyrosine phosphatase (PTP) superfamily phosphohydrolase (DUF442 family)
MSLDSIRNFVAIDSRIATAGQPTESQLRDVAAAGYQAVVNLGLLDSKYCLPDEASSATALGLDYRHIPVRFDAPAARDFEAFAAVMDEWSGKRVFVHCAANYRVSCFVALYGERRLGWTADEADAQIRRVWTPNETWLAFVRAMRLRFADRSG